MKAVLWASLGALAVSTSIFVACFPPEKQKEYTRKTKPEGSSPEPAKQNPAPAAPQGQNPHSDATPAANEQLIGEAKLAAKSASQAAGTVFFYKTPTGVRLIAQVTGVMPGDHGIHVHEKGDCSADDGSSAGGHFNPGGTNHGGPKDDARHAGDFGNITISPDGKGQLDIQAGAAGSFSDWSMIIGKSVILHAATDDLKSQPVGNAGARIACGVIGGQGQTQNPAPTPTPAPAPVQMPAAMPLATAKLEAKSGSMAAGTVSFFQVGKKVRIVAELSGVTAGDHAIHVHEKGDCSAMDASSAGGHYNPKMAMHAGPMDAMRHAGDFGNITIGADGKGKLDLEVGAAGDFEDWASFVGKALILHAAADDLKSQPVGNAGARIACGVLTK